ncbi:hypothetical protein CGMCC3_g6736 [Colletotrichum fructicola]|nr:uncharacterized protein CGMCC3_g6736 [Colletotrichum fructicola]KAE9577074.1 hypothetical protein CGMCC3_g6736 [Colletotrichum fructicola]
MSPRCLHIASWTVQGSSGRNEAPHQVFVSGKLFLDDTIAAALKKPS